MLNFEYILRYLHVYSPSLLETFSLATTETGTEPSLNIHQSGFISAPKLQDIAFSTPQLNGKLLLLSFPLVQIENLCLNLRSSRYHDTLTEWLVIISHLPNLRGCTIICHHLESVALPNFVVLPMLRDLLLEHPGDLDVFFESVIMPRLTNICVALSVQGDFAEPWPQQAFSDLLSRSSRAPVGPMRMEMQKGSMVHIGRYVSA